MKKIILFLIGSILFFSFIITVYLKNDCLSKETIDVTKIHIEITTINNWRAPTLKKDVCDSRSITKIIQILKKLDNSKIRVKTEDTSFSGGSSYFFTLYNGEKKIHSYSIYGSTITIYTKTFAKRIYKITDSSTQITLINLLETYTKKPRQK